MAQKFKILKDNKEKPGWDFSDSKYCESTDLVHLDTGDYTLQGFEKSFIIERKASTKEIAININESRFEKELIRLEEFSHPFMICEFTWDDVYKFPLNSGIPQDRWKALKVTPGLILSKLLDYELKYKTKIILAGDNAKDLASFIFYKVANGIIR